MSESNENQMKYFFACVEYEEPRCVYAGVCGSYNFVKTSGKFELDHYPNKNEIITNIVSDFESDKCIYKNPVIICYNELTKEAYDAYY